MAAAKRGGSLPPPPPGKQRVTPSINLEALRADLRKATDDETIPDPLAVEKVDVYPTGSIVLDLALGVGGWPRGGLHAIEGFPGSGKTALAYLAAGAIQREHPEAVGGMVDIEHSHSESLALICGLDTNPDRFLVARPTTAEQACELVLRMLGYEPARKGEDGAKWQHVRQGVQYLIYDSWAGSPTEESGLAGLARVGAAYFPTIMGALRKTNTPMFLINQMREKPAVMFGDPRYTSGGNAKKHAESSRVWVSMVNAVFEKTTDGKKQVAHDLKIEIKKLKVAPPFERVFLHLNYRTGFDLVFDAKSALDTLGYPLKESPTGNVHIFEYGEGDAKETIRENGEAKFLDALRTDPEAQAAFIELARAQSKARLNTYVEELRRRKEDLRRGA